MESWLQEKALKGFIFGDSEMDGMILQAAKKKGSFPERLMTTKSCMDICIFWLLKRFAALELVPRPSHAYPSPPSLTTAIY